VMMLSMTGIVVLVGILGGTYPAFYLSSFAPVTVMKGVSNSGRSGGAFRKVLTVIQFTIAAVMIACTLVVIRQLNFLQNMDQGWTMDNVVTLLLPDNEPIEQMRLLKEKLLENPQIEQATLTNTPIGEGSGKVIFNMETDEGMEPRGINFVVVDQDFVETLGIGVLKGRDFSLDYIGDTLTGVMVNQTLADRLKWEEPLDKRVQLGSGGQINGKVIGVIRDYHQTGMYNEVESLMLVYRLDGPILYARLSGTNGQAALSYIQQQWEEVFPGKPFEYEFLADTFRDQFGADRTRRTVFAGFTMLTIFIACLGLLGLVSYTTERRTREISIRKVYGASVPRILRLIIREFFLLVVIASLIAVPAVWFLMKDWLQNYVYRTDLTPLVFFWTLLLLLVPTLITISLQSYRAATANPADALYVE